MKKMFFAGSLVAAAMAMAPAVEAATVVALPDIGTFTSYTESDTSLTFSGTGFLGLYGGQNADSFAHLFGLEDDDYSRTVAQIDLSGFSGPVTSAVLSFDILDGTDAGTFTVVGSEGNGALGYQWAAPTATYGSTSGPVTGGANSIDITALLNAALAANEDWLNLHFTGSSGYRWTYTDGGAADRANVRLTIDGNAVPEPATWAMMIGGMGLVGASMRRRKTVVSFA